MKFFRHVFRACALLLLAGCSRPAEDPATATRDFLRAVTRGEFAQAYQSTAFGFQALQTEGAFCATAQELALVGAAIDSVDLQSASGRTAKVKAIMNTARGLQPFTITLEQEKGQWRVFSLKSPSNPGTGLSEDRFSPLGKTLAFSDTSTQTPPDDATVLRLVRDSMNDFAQAISDKSFTHFYHNVSHAWQVQLSERQLERAFQGFIDQQVNLSGVIQSSATLDAPAMVSTDGLLLVSGHYPTKPYEVIFVFRFVSEENEWKLFGLDVNLRQAPGAATPAAARKP